MRSVTYLKSNGVNVEKSLELFGNLDAYNARIGEFIVSASEKVNKLNVLKESKDLYNFALFARSLKNDAKYFGFEKLSSVANELEMRANVGDLFYITSNFKDLVIETNNSINIIRNYLNGNDNDVVVNDSSNNSTYNTRSVLVVDDSNIVRNFVKKLYEGEFVVGTAVNGQEAIDIINANKDNNNIEAILLDLNMPKVDGFQVLEFMKENDLFDKIPVSIITGDSTKETIDKAFKYPIVDMLGKPFNINDVKSVLEKTRLINTYEG